MMRIAATFVLILFFFVTITVLAQRQKRDTSPKIPENVTVHRDITYYLGTRRRLAW